MRADEGEIPSRPSLNERRKEMDNLFGLDGLKRLIDKIRNQFADKTHEHKMDLFTDIPIFNIREREIESIRKGKLIMIDADNFDELGLGGSSYSMGNTGFKVWGVRIDMNNSNPQTAITPTDDSVFGAPLNFGERPCLLKDGEVNYYLDPMNFNKRIDGTDADIISGADGDVMSEIPRMAYFISIENNDIVIKLTNHQNAKTLDPRFRYYGHTRDTEGDCKFLYYGAYQASELAGRLRSLSNKYPLTSNTITQFRSKARAHGDGYDIISFYPITLTEVMFIMRYCHLNSQLALGEGVSEWVPAVSPPGTNLQTANCTTAGNVVAKVATLAGFVRQTGAQLLVNFTNENSANAPTLNVNNTGAAPIYHHWGDTGLIVHNRLKAGVQLFEFDGARWNLLHAKYTGGTETWGMYGGSANKREHVKFAGIEDWYGNVWDRFDGIHSAADFTLLTAFKDFNDEGTGYTPQAKFLSAAISSLYMRRPVGITEAGFFTSSNQGGSATTYFCDGQWYNASMVGGFFGGSCNYGTFAGAFALILNDPASYSGAHTGSRLMYLKKATVIEED
jgi:hypothetical protein